MNSIALLIRIAMTMTVIAYSNAQKVDNSTIHIFLLMVPESKVEALRRRAARQEEGAVGALGAIAEAAGPAANVGQILQGVLGGDLSPIFAGSLGFVPDGDFRDGVENILQQTIAPTIQRILMEFNMNVQRHFNSTTTTLRPTPSPQQPINTNNQLQQQQNFNNFNNNPPPYQPPQQQFQPPYNQFQQPNQQFGGGFGGSGVGGVIGGGSIGGGLGGGINGGGLGAGNVNGQYNPNFQQNQLYQPPQGYPNQQLQQPPSFANNQIGSNQFYPQNNLPPRKPNYNQYQQPVQPPIRNTNNLNSPPFQAPLQNAQPPFSGQFQSNIPPPTTATQTQQLQHQFQPPPQTFPQPVTNNRVDNVQQFVPRRSTLDKKLRLFE